MKIRHHILYLGAIITLLITSFGITIPATAQETDAHADHEEEHAHEEAHDHEDEHEDEEDHGHEADHEDEHGHEDDHEDEHSHEEEANSSQIDNDIASEVGIATAFATEQTLQQSITSYGTLTTGSEQLSHMRARFPGLVTSVEVDLGDNVSAGDRLAEVESNDSLKKYPVLAPISGTIVQRHANTGESTDDKILFSIANLDRLWAEFRIYPQQSERVSSGQKVQVTAGQQTLNGEIVHLIPALDQPYLIARISLENQDRVLSPGQMVEGHILIGEFPVELAVEKDAIQELEGRSGVFVKDGEIYEFMPLTLGRSDDRYVEVLAGLEESQPYVNRNSYLIKADIEKSEAEHAH